MNLNKYTEKAQEAILAAQQLADREGNPEILPEHLLLTLTEQREGMFKSLDGEHAKISDLLAGALLWVFIWWAWAWSKSRNRW